MSDENGNGQVPDSDREIPSGAKSPSAVGQPAATRAAAEAAYIRRHAKRDQQVRRAVTHLRNLVPHLDKPEFLPLVRSFVRVTLLIERAYEVLRDGKIVDDAGELRSSLTSINTLMKTQSALARELGLSPSSLKSIGTQRQTLDLEAIRAAFKEVEDVDFAASKDPQEQ